MAKLTGQTIAASYDQLLIVDDADGISSSLQAIESADTGGSSSALKIATNKVEVIPGSNDANAFEVSQADGTAVLTVDSSTPAVSFNDNNITNVGNIALDSISSDAGTSINVVLGSDAGDDFTVDTSKLVVEGDTGRVGIGTASPSSLLSVASAETQIFEVAPDTGNDRVKIFAYDRTNSHYVDMFFGDDKLILDSSGSVGIGTTSPDHKLHIEGDLCVDGFGTDSNYISMREAFAPDVSGGSGFKAYDHSGSNRDGLAMYGHDGLSFWTAQTERMRIDSSGNLDMTNGGGDIIMANGAGIDFSAKTPDSSGTVSSELLDDYEEGTWTPGYISGFPVGGYSTDYATYTKIGNMMFIQARIDVKNDGTTMQISGLPESSNASQGSSFSIGHVAGTASTHERIEPSSSILKWTWSGTNAAAYKVYIEGSYRV